jgi:hypothetical protein
MKARIQNLERALAYAKRQLDPLCAWVDKPLEQLAAIEHLERGE